MAVKSDSTLWAWGSNSSGQLGVGTFVNAITPVQVHNPAGTGFLTGVAAVVAGSDYSLALEDTTPPVLTTPTSVAVEATGPSGATVTFAASASDPDDMAGPVTCSPMSDSVFPIATTTVMCSSTDTHGNAGSASFTVTVRDTTPPNLTLPANIMVDATSPSGTVVTYTTLAADIVDGAGPVTCTPASGATFGIGTTTVKCSASDKSGNPANGMFLVTILSPAQITSNLISEVAMLNFQQGSNLLEVVLSSLSRGNTGAACNQLGAFINQVQAQTGKQLTAVQANQLIHSATDARSALGCR